MALDRDELPRYSSFCIFRSDESSTTGVHANIIAGRTVLKREHGFFGCYLQAPLIIKFAVRHRIEHLRMT